MTLPSGLSYHPDFIDRDSEELLLEYIDQQDWNTSLRRRTQHYGHRYDYAQKTAVGQEAPPIAGPLAFIAHHLAQASVFLADPDGSGIEPQQCIVNEYIKGQGIAAHTDARSFGPVVVSISLLAPTVMVFTRPGFDPVRVLLEPRSALIMSGEARFDWKHEIPARVRMEYPDGSIHSQANDYRRISLTFRTMA